MTMAEPAPKPVNVPEEAAAKPQASAKPAPSAGAAGHGADSSARVPDVVSFKAVTKKFGSIHAPKVALQDVSFIVEDAPNVGELITIVGPSGCGKSTLLRIIAGLKPHFPPSHGEALVFDKPIREAGPDRGLVDQKYSLLPHLTVVENIAFGLKLRGVSRTER